MKIHTINCSFSARPIIDGDAFFLLSQSKETDEVPVERSGWHFIFGRGLRWLTNSAFDPITLTAEYNACAVRLEKAWISRRGVRFSLEPDPHISGQVRRLF